MKNNIEKIYDLEIHRYKNNKTLYILQSFEIDKKSTFLTNIKCLLKTKNKYELKIKLNLLGLSFRKLTADTCYYNTESNKSIKSARKFELKYSYEN